MYIEVKKQQQHRCKPIYGDAWRKTPVLNQLQAVPKQKEQKERVYAANRRAQRMARFDIFAFVSRVLDSPAVHCTPAAMG